MQFKAPNFDVSSMTARASMLLMNRAWAAHRRDLHLHKATVEWIVYTVDLHALLGQIGSLRVVVSTVGWVVQPVGHEEHQLTTSCPAAVIHRPVARGAWLFELRTDQKFVHS